MLSLFAMTSSNLMLASKTFPRRALPVSTVSTLSVWSISELMLWYLYPYFFFRKSWNIDTCRRYRLNRSEQEATENSQIASRCISTYKFFVSSSARDEYPRKQTSRVFPRLASSEGGGARYQVYTPGEIYTNELSEHPRAILAFRIKLHLSTKVRRPLTFFAPLGWSAHDLAELRFS